ncbi:hypothetical protein E2C01_073654 [Portunus trituberculatus]|uniref:Uncharacterized protein n=1 Tax=Portunus trituberculatus TaxID=210409 RepID=A0A5B7I198_PORTR|nr:hypothetical protein [Portunus trituberculatus]
MEVANYKKLMEEGLSKAEKEKEKLKDLVNPYSVRDVQDTSATLSEPGVRDLGVAVNCRLNSANMNVA